MFIAEGVNELYVGKKVVIVIEFTPQGKERGKEQDPKLGFVLEYLWFR
jgi:hypothetical protein